MRPTNYHTYNEIKSQFTFLCGPDGQLQADYLGKVETMQASYNEVAKRLGIATIPLDHANRSRRGDYKDYYDQQLIDGVARIYARDLDLFGYDY